jgi:hypothetical protein
MALTLYPDPKIKSKGGSMNMPTRSRLVICLLAFALVFVSLPGASLTVQENFIVAYVTSENKINIRSTPVNVINDWVDGAFPSSVQAGRGVGLAVDKAGVMNIALTDTSNGVRMVWGLGPAIWDSTARSFSAAPPVSAPVGVHLGENRWAIAFRRSGDTVFIGVYDHSKRRFLYDAAPFGVLNTKVEGRPSLAVSGNNVIATWRRFNGASFDLVTACGNFQQGYLIFAPPQLVSTAAGSGLKGGVTSDPVVARSGTTFYLAVVREQQGSGVAGSLHGWRTQLFSSPDGQAWSSIGITTALEVINKTYLGLGGASNGTLLAAALNPLRRTTVLSVARFVNGHWQQASRSEISKMFDMKAAYKYFVIVGSKP